MNMLAGINLKEFFNHSAFNSEDHNQVQYFINHCFPDLNVKDEQGRTLLHHAVLNNHYKFFSSIRRNRKLFRLHEQDNEGNTILHLAIINHKISTDIPESKSNLESSILPVILEFFESQVQVLNLKNFNQDSIFELIKRADDIELYRLVFQYLIICRHYPGSFFTGCEESCVSLMNLAILAQFHKDRKTFWIDCYQDVSNVPIQVVFFLEGLLSNNLKLINLVQTSVFFSLRLLREFKEKIYGIVLRARHQLSQMRDDAR